jgi:hypothetical protein
MARIPIPLSVMENNIVRCGQQDWLGYGHVDNPALWALFFAFATSVLQVSTTTQSKLFCRSF